VIEEVPRGEYSVTARLHGYESGDDSYTVSVPENGCGELNIAMWTASRLAGTVLTNDGSPAPNIVVDLSRVEDGDLQWPAESISDQDGRFEFRRVPVRNYVV